MLTCHCKTCKRERRALRPKLLAVVVVVILAGLLAVASVGCSTVVPRAVNEPVQPSFDGNEQNSGIVASTESGFIVTAYFRDRYNALVAIYGDDFLPPITKDAGLTEIEAGRWQMTRQAMRKFLEMNAWRRAALAPVNPKS